MLPLAALVGGFVGGPLLEVLGRKTTIMTTAIPFMGAGKKRDPNYSKVPNNRVDGISV